MWHTRFSINKKSFSMSEIVNVDNVNTAFLLV